MPYSSVSGTCSPRISFSHPGACWARSKLNRRVLRTSSALTLPLAMGMIRACVLSVLSIATSRSSSDCSTKSVLLISSTSANSTWSTSKSATLRSSSSPRDSPVSWRYLASSCSRCSHCSFLQASLVDGLAWLRFAPWLHQYWFHSCRWQWQRLFCPDGCWEYDSALLFFPRQENWIKPSRVNYSCVYRLRVRWHKCENLQYDTKHHFRGKRTGR